MAKQYLTPPKISLFSCLLYVGSTQDPEQASVCDMMGVENILVAELKSLAFSDIWSVMLPDNTGNKLGRNYI